MLEKFIVIIKVYLTDNYKEQQQKKNYKTTTKNNHANLLEHMSGCFNAIDTF